MSELNLKSLVVDCKTAWVDFPGCDGFSVEVANLSRKELQALRKGCLIQKLNRKTRMMEETLDDEKFVRKFTESTIKNWKGLTFKHLESLILIDTDGLNLEDELPFSKENAEVLVSGSTEFDQWLNEVAFDINNFRSGK